MCRWLSGLIAQGQVQAASRLVEERGGLIVLVEEILDTRLQPPIFRQGILGAHVERGVATELAGVGEIIIAFARGEQGGAQKVR